MDASGSGALGRLETALRKAATRYASGLRAAEGAREAAAAVEGVLVRLGYPAGLAAGIMAEPARSPGRAAAQALVARELVRLKRAAQASRFDYDPNRHIAVRRAFEALKGSADRRPDAGRDSRLPGSAINRRFAGRSGPRCSGRVAFG